MKFYKKGSLGFWEMLRMDAQSGGTVLGAMNNSTIANAWEKSEK